MGTRGMEHAWIAGKPAALDTEIAEAAKLLASSPHPFIAGLGTDVAGARAAIAPAERVGAVIDHLHAAHCCAIWMSHAPPACC
jgi:formylmethanofuran dehydrogenase subunit B